MYLPVSHQEPENNNLGTSIREGFKYREVHFKIMRLAGGTRGKRLCDPESRNCRKPSLPCQGSSEPTLHCFHWARQPCSSTDHCPSRDLAHRSLCLIQAHPARSHWKSWHSCVTITAPLHSTVAARSTAKSRIAATFSPSFQPAQMRWMKEDEHGAESLCLAPCV